MLEADRTHLELEALELQSLLAGLLSLVQNSPPQLPVLRALLLHIEARTTALNQFTQTLKP